MEAKEWLTNPMVQFAKWLASKGVATMVVTTRFIQRTAGVDEHAAGSPCALKSRAKATE